MTYQLHAPAEPSSVYRVFSTLVGLLRRHAPLIVVSAMLLLSATVAFNTQQFDKGPGVIGFAMINRVRASDLGISQAALHDADAGYDGQFFYFLTYRPSLLVTCASSGQDTITCPVDHPTLRFERIMYPVLVWLVALGQPLLLSFSLLLVNFLAILTTVALVSRLAIEAGASRWLGVAAGIFCGEIFGFLRDLADPVAVMFLVAAVTLIRHDRFRLGAVALAAALLTREQLLVCVPLLVLPLLVQRRWWLLAQSTLLALAPFVAWQIVLAALYHIWPLISADSNASQLDFFPFQGLLQTRGNLDFWPIVLCVALPLFCAGIIALLALRQQYAGNMRHSVGNILADPLPLLVFGYSVLLSLTYWFQWSDIWGPSRLAAPAVVLAVIVAARLPRPNLSRYYGLLVAATSILPLYKFIYLR